MAGTPQKLSFVIAGVQKSGTSTLDAHLRQHPEIQMASTKETHFFDDEKRNWLSPDYSGLNRNFIDADDRLRGESTPITLYWRPAIRRLHRYRGDIKIVLLLRNPVTRAFSHWRKEYSRQMDDLPFEEAIRSGRSRIADQPEVEGLHRIYSYVERGFYAEQIDYLTRYFSRGQIHCEIFEDFFSDYRSGLDRVTSFLGVSPFAATKAKIHANPSRPFQYPSVLSADSVSYLLSVFGHDISQLEKWLGRSLSSWRELSPAE